jgi:hypothetical protein
MKHATELKLQAWVDGELNPRAARRIARQVEIDPAARELAAGLRGARHALRVGEPQRFVAESREFYWSGIRRRIELAENTADAGHCNRKGFLRPWLRWLAPAGALAVSAFLLYTVGTPQPSGLETLEIATEIDNPLDDVSSVTFRSEQDHMTVVWISMK